MENYANSSNTIKSKLILVTSDEECKKKAKSLEIVAESLENNDHSEHKKIFEKNHDKDNAVNIIFLPGVETYSFDNKQEIESAQYSTVVSLQNLLQVINEENVKLGLLLVVTKNVLALENTNNFNFIISTISGFVKAAFDEGYNIKQIDLDDKSYENIINIINDELGQLDVNQVLYRNSIRYRIKINEIDVPSCASNISIKKGGCYLITGGLGGIGTLIASTLLKRLKAHVLLIGRSKLANANSEKTQRYNELQMIAADNGSISYQVCDIESESEVKQVLVKFEKEIGQKLDGVIHLAGSIVEKLIKEQTVEELLSVYQAKLIGTMNILRVIKDHSDITFVTTSSARMLLPGISVSAYTSASEFNAHMANYAKNVLGIHAVCISWSQWDEIGMSKGLIVKSGLAEKGFALIKEERGMDSFLLALQFNKPYVYIGIDSTKMAMKKLTTNLEDTKDSIVIYTSYQNLLKKEEQFKNQVIAIINENQELADKKKEFRILLNLPVDKNGFVDKETLKERENYLLGKASLVKPRTECEKQVFECWKTIFKSVSFGVIDNFFKLGGDSIKMIRLLSALNTTFNIKIKNQHMFRLTTIEQQAKFIEEKYKVSAVKENPVAEKEEQLEDESEEILLSAQQMRQWIMYKMDPESPYYNNTIAITIKGMILIPCLKMAIHQLIQRHDILRTICQEDGEKIYQVVKDDVDFEIEQIDISSKTKDLNGTLQEYYQKEANKIIKIDKDLPIRATIFTINPTESVLLMSIHHIASDGWSMGVLIKDLSTIYSNIMTSGVNKLPKLTMQYADFVKWQKTFLSSDDYKKQISYWKTELDEMPPALELPYDEARMDYAENKGKRIIFEINEKTTSEIKNICKKESSTLYMFLMSIFANLMQRYSNQTDMILGTLIANRNQEELEKMIGFFVNTIPIRLTFNENESFLNLLSQVKKKTLEMYDNQDVPFDVLVDELGTERESGKNPLFQVLFIVQNAQIETIKDEQAEWNLEILDSDTSKFDLIVQVFERENKLFVKYEYDTSLFHDDTMERWCRHFQHLIKEVVQDPNEKVGDYDIINDAERKQILSINNSRTDYAKDCDLYELFCQVCEKYKDNIALSYKDESLTYEQTKYKVDCLAAYLQEKGIKHGDIVMIITDKRLESIIGMLAILKNGCAYLPITPKYPNDFVEYIVSNSKTKFVLCNSEYSERKCLSPLTKIILNKEYKENNLVQYEKIDKNDKAYVIYTSGSTGNPKGVIVKQQSVIRLVNKSNIYDFGPDDITLQSGSLAFDVSITEIWATILNGSHLHLVDEDVCLDTEVFKKEILKIKPTFMWISAPLFSMLVEMDETLFETVPTLITGGDIVSPKATNKVRKHNKDIVIINGYGPTENTSFSTIYKIRKDFDGPIPIGHPISNSSTYIVNKNMKLQPIGVMGELLVGGDGVALGYLNNPELTEKLFKKNPFEPGTMMYMTGDYASVEVDGEITFYGRIDGQVKVRGFRIELSAIEKTMLDIEGIEQVLVRCIGSRENEKKIVAYYTGKTIDNIKDCLGEKLPEYMIPSYIMQLDMIPLNKNGKIDTKSLPDITQIRESSEIEYESPQTEKETDVFEVWAHVLSTREFGINDNFFKLGGDSIMIIQLTNLIKQCGYNITTKQVFKYQTVKRLAMHIEKNDEVETQDVVSGEGLLGPIQRWFFEQKYGNMNLWNLPEMIHFKKMHNAEIIHKALNSVVSYHDCLQTKFTSDSNGYHQIFGEKIEEVSMNIVNMENVDDKKAVMAKECEKCQELIDIEKGIVVSAVLFEEKDAQHLFIAVHHLVVDGISLRIIGEDMIQAIDDLENNREIKFMQKTVSVKKWNEKLSEYAQSSSLKEEYAFWKKVNDQIEDFIKVDFVNTEENSTTQLITIDKSVTSLLKKINKNALGIEVNQVLIAALAKTIHDTFGMENVPIKLEGHGREDVIKDMDIFRTVGWFTTQFPVVFNFVDKKDLTDILLSCKEKITEIKNRGIGYGILKYLTKSEEIDLNKEPQITFNYLGNIDKEIEVGSREYGIFRDPLYERDCYLEFNIILQNGEMLLYLTMNNELLNKKKFDKVLEKYAENIKTFLQYCYTLKDKLYTASDFELAQLEKEQLEQITKQYGTNIKDIYPLSYSQKGMLYQYMMDTAVEDYFGQVHCPVSGELDKECFEKAWNKVVENNDILTTVYKWEDLVEPVQIVLNDMEIKVEYFDARNQNSSEEEYLEDVLLKDRQVPFKLEQTPLARVKLIQMSDRFEFVFSFPHISLDGWSVFVILGELLKCYYAYKNEEVVSCYDTKSQYREYIGWLMNQDMKEMKNYWSEYMNDFEEKNHFMGIDEEAEENNDFVQQTFTLTKEEEIQLKNTAKDMGVTLSTMLEGALAITLSKFSEDTDIVFGTTVSGRAPEIEYVDSVTGLLINTLPLRIQVDDVKKVNEFVTDIQNEVIEMKDNEIMSMAEIKSLSKVNNTEELFDVLLVFENYPVDKELSSNKSKLLFGEQR